MRESVAAFIKPLADFFLGLVAVFPMWSVKVIFLGILVLVAIWVFSLPRQMPEGKDSGFFSDLRVMAFGILLLQSLFYLIF